MDTAPPEGASGALVSMLGRWWRQGFRTAFFRAPDWHGLHATPPVLAALFVAAWTLSIAIERLYIAGPATFYWPALYLGWLSTAATMSACWLLDQATATAGDHGRQPSGAQWFGMLTAQTTTFIVALSGIFVPLVRGDALPKQATWTPGYLLVWIVPVLWMTCAQTLVVWRSSASIKARVLASVLLVAVAVLPQFYRPPAAWYPAPSARDDFDSRRLQITQDVWELQPTLLVKQLQELKAERPGVVDVYAITFAPDAGQDVFRNESELVADVLERRFDAVGHTMQLVNHLDTIRERPWATITNLQRAIRRAAELMNRDEDILFVHLTSHGGRDGRLSASLWPLTLDPLTPALLKQWLDDAGIRYRVVSISACYSGSWIEPLAGDGTLVMTAADAAHTSFGCGKGSQLTYFGRAMFDEQLRRTWSFEDAHAAARVDIERREKEAGKTDGYSNPQIRVGADVRRQLTRLGRERAASAGN